MGACRGGVEARRKKRVSVVERDRERGREKRREVPLLRCPGESGMHWFRITFLFHFTRRTLPFSAECNPDFSLETQYLHHTNRRIWRECDTHSEYGSFFLSLSATLTLFSAPLPLLLIFFLSLSLLSQNEVFQGGSQGQIKETHPILQKMTEALLLSE